MVPMTRLLNKNSPEWWMIALGLIGSMAAGAVTPVFSIFFGKILGVFANPPNKVFHLVHPWAGLFLALACVTGIANLLKVCAYIYMICTAHVISLIRCSTCDFTEQMLI